MDLNNERRISIITVAGASAVWDYIFPVSNLPSEGGIVEITKDCAEPLPGGCAPNIACGIAKLCNCSPQLYYPVGKDFPDSGLLEKWQDLGIDCSNLTINTSARSGYSYMYMQEDGATMCFGFPGAASDALPDVRKEFGGWLVIAPVFNQYTKKILEHGISTKRKIVLTGIGNKKLLPYLDDLYMLIINGHEAKELANSDGNLSVDDWIKRVQIPYVFVTHGSEGSIMYHGKEKVSIPVIPGQGVKCFTGAGDAYTSGVVSASIKGYSPIQAGYIGSTNSSFVIEKYGGQSNLPNWTELMERLKLYFPNIITQ